MVANAQPEVRQPFQWLRNLVAICGKTVAWLTLAMVLLTFTIVVLRYGFNLGWIWLQESLTYMHVAVFSVAAAWTLQKDEHVRVDIFYSGMTTRKRAWVDMLGTLVFLLPFCIFLIVMAWPYVANSWKLLETSREAGGLPLVFVLKSLMIVLPVLLLFQALLNVFDAVKTIKSPAR